MDALTLGPIKSLSGEIRLPGSKSISNRTLLLAALARGRTRIVNLLESEDTELMRRALDALGIAVSRDGDAWVVEGGHGPLVTDGRRAELNLGLAGTAIRPLAAALTLGNGEFTLDGAPRMRERPIGHLVDALRDLGANIDYADANGFPPVRIRAGGLAGGEAEIDGSVSSQFLTSVLLAAPLAQRPVTLSVRGELVSKPYIDITLDLMARFGAEVRHAVHQRFEVANDGYRSPGECLVEGDASAATYFLAAGAIAGRGVRVHGVGAASIQGDAAFADVLEAMGAQVERRTASIAAQPGPLTGIDADLNYIPDAAMTVAVLALFAKGTTRIGNIANWRVKETDRLAAMAQELRKLGADVQEGPDHLTIEPPPAFKPATIETYGDHRMAMCFSLAALGGVPVTIKNPGCVAKTFPDYFDRFTALIDG